MEKHVSSARVSDLCGKRVRTHLYIRLAEVLVGQVNTASERRMGQPAYLSTWLLHGQVGVAVDGGIQDAAHPESVACSGPEEREASAGERQSAEAWPRWQP